MLPPSWRQSRCVGCTTFDVALLPQYPLRCHFHLRHREPIRLDVKRERKKRYLARKPEKQARIHQLMSDIRSWLAETFLLHCEPVERLFRLLWEEYPYEEKDDSAPED